MWKFIISQLLLWAVFAAGGSNDPAWTSSAPASTAAVTTEAGTTEAASDSDDSEESHSWGYPSNNAAWGGLCETGESQSPIDLPSFSRSVDMRALNFSAYGSKGVWAHDNGHSMVWNFDQGSTTLDGQTYSLKQFHAHTASEHTENGDQADLALHFVHANADGELAVVGVMCDSAGNTQDTFFDGLTASASEETEVNPKDLFAKLNLQHYFQFSGSLTTPPCSEGVFWTVMTTRCRVPQSFMDLMNSKVSMESNFREVQPLNGRSIAGVITYDHESDDSRGWTDESYTFLFVPVILFGIVLCVVFRYMAKSGVEESVRTYEAGKRETVEMAGVATTRSQVDEMVLQQTEDWQFFAPTFIQEEAVTKMEVQSSDDELEDKEEEQQEEEEEQEQLEEPEMQEAIDSLQEQLEELLDIDEVEDATLI